MCWILNIYLVSTVENLVEPTTVELPEPTSLHQKMLLAARMDAENASKRDELDKYFDEPTEPLSIKNFD